MPVVNEYYNINTDDAIVQTDTSVDMGIDAGVHARQDAVMPVQIEGACAMPPLPTTNSPTASSESSALSASSPSTMSSSLRDLDAFLDAHTHGYVAQLRNLAHRPEATHSSMIELVAALKATGGLVNAAKRLL